MLAAVCIGTNDMSAAKAFYDDVLQTIGMTRLETDETELGYGVPAGEPSFWILIPYDRKDASPGNGCQVTFVAKEQAAVDAFHAAVMERGGRDEGAPGPRTYAEGYYGAYCRDLDGNKMHVFHIPNPA